MKTWAGYLLSPLVLLLFCCTPPTIHNTEQAEVMFVGEPQWILFQMEEWEGHKEGYIRTFGDIKVTGTIQNIGMGEAKDVILIVDLYASVDCNICIYEGESFICSSLDAGARYAFYITHNFEFIHEGIAKGVRLNVQCVGQVNEH